MLIHVYYHKALECMNRFEIFFIKKSFSPLVPFKLVKGIALPKIKGEWRYTFHYKEKTNFSLSSYYRTITTPWS